MNTTRRDFLRSLTGIVVVIIADPFRYAEAASAEPDFNAYLRIAPDGRITVFSGKIEMGQGVTTSLAQEAAEELGVRFDAIEMVMGDTALVPFDAGTWGSLSTRVFGQQLRAAAAQAREVLLDLASSQMKVSVDRLRIEDGVVIGPKSRLTFGQIAKGQKIQQVLNRKAELTTSRKEIGKPRTKVEAISKVTGAAKYAGDIKLPGMLYARILRPPAHGATLRSVDTSAAAAIATVVNQDGIVAVLAEHPDAAAEALSRIKAEWNPSTSTLTSDNIHDHFLAAMTKEAVPDQAGSIETGVAASVKVFEHTYFDGYCAHASIETHTALADAKDDKVTLWVSTQSPFGDQRRVSQTLGIPLENVRIITPQVGGGFGGKSTSPQAVEAARLSRIVGKPVQVMWTRAEEFFYDMFHSAAVVKIRSGIDADGRIVLWDYRVYGAGGRGAEVYYDIPNRRVAIMSGERGVHPFATGPWRAPGANTNTFARESQIDIMAHAAGIDPLEFRIRNTKDPRMLSVLRAVQPKYRKGMGVACGIDAGTYVAHLGEIEVSGKSIKVKRVVCAQEMGLIVNPQGATIQVEGCITMGLGYALAETVRFRNGEVLEKNFDTYSLPRFSWVPQIETILVKNDELAPQGGGEPAILCVGAIVGNALYNSTGRRAFRLPIS